MTHTDNHQWITDEFDNAYGCSCQLEEKQYDESDYFTPEDLEALEALDEIHRKETYLLKELILTDIELLTI